MEFHVYRSNLGLFVKEAGYPRYANPKFNGVEAEGKYRKIYVKNGYNQNEWWFLEGVQEISSYETLQKGAPKLVLYELNIPSVACEQIPSQLLPEQVEAYYDNSGDFQWLNYNEMRGMYKAVYESTPDVWTAQEFKVFVLQDIQIESFNSPVEMTVKQRYDNYGGKETEVDLRSIVTYSELEALLTPEFLLHERPCYLSGEQVYKMVRAHVRNHINGMYARITSDYDFCFTVQRKVAIKPYTSRTEIKNRSGRSYATPKFNVQTVSHKEVKLFEMAPKAYQSYPVIEGWHARNLKEMAEQIKVYLDDLMAEINRPVQECSHCNGMGHVGIDVIKTNERGV